MGKDLLDVYSISHFIAGIVFHQMGLTRKEAYLLHVFFELFENYIYIPYFGGRCINIKYILPIEDCKTYPDTFTNMLGDQLCFMLGYELVKKIKYIPMLPKYSIYFIPIIPTLFSLITTNILGYTPKYEIK